MSKRPLVLILGAQGLLGTSLVGHLLARGYEVLRHARRDELDVRAELTNAREVGIALDKARPQIIVNLAALTNVDECEKHPQLAFQANVRIVENLVNWMKTKGAPCHLVQLSTDQVYDGLGPHKENEVSLSNLYGFSKYAGELVAAQTSSTVLRTNFVGPSLCPGRVSLSDWVVKSLRLEKQIVVFEDVQFSPLTLQRLAEMIEMVLVNPIPGIFNLGSRDGLSKAEFAFMLAKTLGLSTSSMSRGISAAAGLNAYRPKDMRMDSSLFEKTYGVLLPSLNEEIKSMRSAYEHAA